MSAGTGVQHSEYNPDTQEPLHLYQIWILPAKDGITPRYEQRKFSGSEHQQLILSPDARDGTLLINQDMTLTRLLFDQGQSSQLNIAEKRNVWLQVVKGQVTLSGHRLQTSDAAAITQESLIELKADIESEILVFDLPPVE
jgi:quercetin 2,3-dioxygenase